MNDYVMPDVIVNEFELRSAGSNCHARIANGLVTQKRYAVPPRLCEAGSSDPTRRHGLHHVQR
eukprot:14616439-Heterocapsa_arctica.AAC.1